MEVEEVEEIREVELPFCEAKVEFPFAFNEEETVRISSDPKIRRKTRLTLIEMENLIVKVK